MNEEEYQRWRELLDKEVLTAEEAEELLILDRQATSVLTSAIEKKLDHSIRFGKKHKKLLALLAGGIVLVGVSSMVSQAGKEEQILKDEGLLLALSNQNNSLERIKEDESDYPKAISTIKENGYTILSSRFDGYTVVTQDGLFRWVSLEGKVFSDLNAFKQDSTIQKLSKEDIQSHFFGAIPSDSSYDTYTVHITNQEDYAQEVYKEDAVVGTGAYVQMNGQFTILYQDTEEEIFTTNLRDFSILNDHKELVEYSQKVKEEKGKVQEEDFTIDSNQEVIFSFAEYYQHLYTLETANKHAYAIPRTAEQTQSVGQNGLYILSEVEKQGLLCINNEKDVVYCATDGNVYTDYLSFLTENNQKEPSQIVDLSLSGIADYIPLETPQFTVLNVDSTTMIADQESRQVVGEILSANIEGIWQPLFYDQTDNTYSSSLEDFDLRRQIKMYKEKGTMPEITEYRELAGFTR